MKGSLIRISQNASQADKEALNLEKQVQEVSKVKTTKETTSVSTSQPADRPVPVTPGSVSQSDPSKLLLQHSFQRVEQFQVEMFKIIDKNLLDLVNLNNPRDQWMMDL